MHIIESSSHKIDQAAEYSEHDENYIRCLTRKGLIKASSMGQVD